ncbi:DUF2357 domain-containing protein [Pseudalkalibacillus sp. A8]|uniref:DUF2357 domain-containing protein n=1 Tax=Pseudalkalibacillus sp. A8 TaxID=3382641 RepID=UPI0038B60296
MALLPSGSFPDDVELIQIETSELSLVLKGKPYHERYEGLKQYKALHQNEVMELHVEGETVSTVKVFDVDQQQLINKDRHRPIFFENGVYQIVITPKDNRKLTFYHEHPQLRQAVDYVGTHQLMMGVLQFRNEVGLSTFEIREGRKTLLEVTVEIFPSKLDYKEDYRKLLEEVNDEIYNLAFHFVRKTYLGAVTKIEGNPSRSEFYRLITNHFRAFLQAIQRIEKQPYHQLVTEHVKVRGDQLRKVDSLGRSYLRKRPHLFVEVKDGIQLGKKKVLPQSGLTTKKDLTYDTHENRFIKQIMQRIRDKIDDLYEKVIAPNRWRQAEPDQELVEEINSMRKELNARLKNPFWKQIGVLDRSVMSLVLQMAPGYRDAFQIYLNLSRGLTLQGKLYRMSVKDVATLYEYWTFLKLGQILSRKYKLVSQDIVKVNRDHLFVNLDTNQTAKRVYKHPFTNEKITLVYQHYEGKLPTLPQKPDNMLSIEKKGKNYEYNYVFDAKYRIDFAVEGSYYNERYKQPGPMEDDINTMHRYRDAIVVEQEGPYERSAFGAYVLFPWFEEESYTEHPFYKSINSVNIGGLPFLPNATNLVEQFVERLIEKSPEEIHEEGILPRGVKEEWQSSFEDKVLVGLVNSRSNAIAHHQHRFYHIPVRSLNKGWQEAKYVALYYKTS